jgi:hypothetical protein
VSVLPVAHAEWEQRHPDELALIYDPARPSRCTGVLRVVEDDGNQATVECSECRFSTTFRSPGRAPCEAEAPF